MSNWVKYDQDDFDWKTKVFKIDSATYLHDNEWAKHLENLGWIVCRWQYQENDTLYGIYQNIYSDSLETFDNLQNSKAANTFGYYISRNKITFEIGVCSNLYFSSKSVKSTSYSTSLTLKSLNIFSIIFFLLKSCL